MPNFGNFEMIKQIFFTLLILFILILTFKSEKDCDNLKNSFRFSFETVQLQLNGDIYNDVNMPLWSVRFFHNKPVYLGRELARKILLFGDARFLVNLPFCISR